MKAIKLDQYQTALAKLGDWHRDALEILGATGWHFTELQRFAADGEIEKHPHTDAPVLVCPHTKGGRPLKTEVQAHVAEAAQRLRDRGEPLDYFEFRNALKSVGAKFNPGVLRHSVATWAINDGADPAKVAAFLGHRSLATTLKFYATFAVPARVTTLSDLGAGKRGAK